VRKVGAFMREGEMLGALLQHENDARGHGLEIMPLYANRKSTELAAIGKLAADNLIGWLERRQTLPVKTILEHFGLDPADFRNPPFPLDETAGTRERVLKLAQYLFTPAIAGRIEARSAEERRKILDYLKPWIGSAAPVGLCDIGYNASAQRQLKRILDLEGHPARLIGCYLVTCERTAFRVLDGLDVRHFIGAFGQPHFNYYAFLRSPAFLEQCLTAPTGTTLGYQRATDGSVSPLLDEMRFPPELLQCQRAFKDGVLLFQKFWLWFRAQKPELLDGASADSQRVLAALDHGCSTILSRATAFPLPEELGYFGSLLLDDYYFSGGVKPICGPPERELARTGGYPKLLTEQSVLWPQGAFHLENTQAASEFFSCGKAMLLCRSGRDDDGIQLEMTIVVPPQREAAVLRDCLNRLKSVSRRNPRSEVLLLTPMEDRETMIVAQEFGREIKRLKVFERDPKQTPVQQLNFAVDESTAPFVVLLDGDTPLSPDWDNAFLGAVRSEPGVALVLPAPLPSGVKPLPGSPDPFLTPVPASFLVRRSAFVEALGFHEDLGLAAGTLNLLLQLHQQGWKTAVSRAGVHEASPAASRLPAADADFLKRTWPDFASQIAAILSGPSPATVPVSSKAMVVDWIGSFLDHGSLSQVNRELTAALKSSPALHLQRVSNGAPVSPGWQSLAREVSTTLSADASVTVRHAWPPDWQRPLHGKLAVIQPWEYGALPEPWVKNSQKFSVGG
jgi:hypothetical protein